MILCISVLKKILAYDIFFNTEIQRTQSCTECIEIHFQIFKSSNFQITLNF